jgi:hypothetical protein
MIRAGALAKQPKLKIQFSAALFSLSLDETDRDPFTILSRLSKNKNTRRAALTE